MPLHFWGDAAEYAAYILNHSPNKANEGGISPIEMLNKKRPVLSDIVVFGSSCTVHVNVNNTSLGVSGRVAIVIGKSDEMKGYRVYLPTDRVVVVTQHVQNVETLTEIQIIKGQEEHGDIESNQKKKGRSSGWTHDRRMTRSTRNQDNTQVEDFDAGNDKDALVMLADPIQGTMTRQ